jgi:hypothetical protein
MGRVKDAVDLARAEVDNVEADVESLGTGIGQVKTAVEATTAAIGEAKAAAEAGAGNVTDAVDAAAVAVGTVKTAVDAAAVAVGTVKTAVDQVKGDLESLAGTVDAVKTAVEAAGAGVDSLNAGCLTLSGVAQALVAQATPCRGVLLRAPAAGEPTDAGPNAAAFFAGSVAYPSAFRIPLTQTDGIYIAIDDAAKLRVIGTASDKVKYVIFAL